MNRVAGHIRFSPWPIMLALAAIAMAAGVFAVTQSVQQRETRVTQLNRDVLAEQQTLRVLEAEWAYLTRPQRLETLMAMKTEHDVMPPNPAPIAPVVTAQAPAPAKIEPAAGAPEARTVRKTADKPGKKQTRAASLTKAAKPKAEAKKQKDIEVWPIGRKAKAPALHAQHVSTRTARAGIARPIVE